MNADPILLPEVRTEVQVRFSDTDAMGHVSSGSYAAWAEVGRADFFRAIPIPRAEIPWFVLVRLELNYHSEGRFGDEFHIVTRASRIGTKSMTLEQKVYVGHRLVCSVVPTMAAFDDATRRAIAVPEGWRIDDRGAPAP